MKKSAPLKTKGAAPRECASTVPPQAVADLPDPLVMLDGMPFNEPFGGWVYWTRVPLEATACIPTILST